MVKVNSRNTLVISDRKVDNDKSKVKMYFSYIGPKDEQW